MPQMWVPGILNTTNSVSFFFFSFVIYAMTLCSEVSFWNPKCEKLILIESLMAYADGKLTSEPPSGIYSAIFDSL